MARLMLSVGDMQVSVSPIPGSIGADPSLQAAFAQMPDDHPLKAGDHEVLFYEIDVGGKRDEVCSAILGEAEALEVVGLWLTLETEREGKIEENLGVLAKGVISTARARLHALFGSGIAPFLP